MAFLQQFLDPSLRVSRSDTPDKLAVKETDRLQELFAVAMAARDIPRRLGADASDEELAEDKRRCRRIAHVAEQSLISWGAEVKPQASASISKAAAQVVWKRWWEEHRTYLDGRMRYIATWTYKTGEHEAWAKTALVKLANEYRWLEYALR